MESTFLITISERTGENLVLLTKIPHFSKEPYTKIFIATKMKKFMIAVKLVSAMMPTAKHIKN